jgi:outer membrane receptor protein involved in Fe transport
MHTLARSRRLHLAWSLGVLAAFAGSTLASSALAHDPKEEEAERLKEAAERAAHAPKQPDPIEITIQAEKPGGESSSRIVIGRRELELRPRLRPGDILEAVPGLFAVQHAGGGKANQYFLRGFDADHGTDVAFSVDGVPINMVSHGHGQGFTDFHFLIPELVTSLDGYKGPFYASQGDFATAGAVNLHLAEKLDESFAQYSIGQYGIMRALVVESPDLGDDWRAVMAGELYKDEGPFLNPEHLKRYNVYLKATHDLGRAARVQMTLMSYGSTWRGSGQIPARAVCGEGEAGTPDPTTLDPPQPCINHFGFVDPTEGGQTQRHLASIAYSTAWGDADFTAMAYAIKYKFTLYSNFTFFAEHPDLGDEIEQDDDRTVVGTDFRVRRHDHYLGGQFTTSLGAQVRVDSIDNALYNDVARERFEDRVNDSITESQIGIYVEEDARVRKWLRFIAGARAQRVDVSVEDHLEDKKTLGNGTSGYKGATQFLPKFQGILSPLPQLDIFASLGRGFHSNDARGVVQQVHPATLLTPAMGYEAGARVTPIPNLTVSASGFLIDLDSELVWAGDAGTTEASGPTRRYGVELDARYRIGNWLFADVDATFTHARYRANEGNGGAVALAPTRTFSAGVGVRPTIGDFTPSGSVRIKSIGARPASEDESFIAEGFTIVDATAGLRWKQIEAGLDVQNLFNATWREVQFVTETRLAYEPRAVTGIHYSPGWPRTMMARATLYWK